MKILLSPAKMLDEQTPFPALEYSVPYYLKQAEQLARILKKWKIKDFEENMHLSEKLSELNFKRYQKWTSPSKESEMRRPAIFTFDGEVYKGFDVFSLNDKHLSSMNDKIMILSGLYGFLKPLDWMFPYRLEMGTRADFGGKHSLYEFWDMSISNYLNKSEKDVVINLASSEYSKVVRLNELKAKVITPIFKDDKNGVLKTVMMYAKHQRGKFARFIIENETNNIADYQSYSEDNYLFSRKDSTCSEWTFIRSR